MPRLSGATRVWLLTATMAVTVLALYVTTVRHLEPIDGPSTWKDQLDAHGDSLHHIAFTVDGMRERLDHLAGHGIPLVQRGEYTGGRYAYVDATGQLGAVLELLEND